MRGLASGPQRVYRAARLMHKVPGGGDDARRGRSSVAALMIAPCWRSAGGTPCPALGAPLDQQWPARYGDRPKRRPSMCLWASDSKPWSSCGRHERSAQHAYKPIRRRKVVHSWGELIKTSHMTSGLSLKWLGAIRATLISVDRYSADGRQTLGGGSERRLAGGPCPRGILWRLLAGRWKEYAHGRP